MITSFSAVPKSPTSEQQIQPEFISVMFTPASFKNPPSMPISPNSFSIRTTCCPFNASLRSFLISVVFPAPRKPLTTIKRFLSIVFYLFLHFVVLFFYIFLYSLSHITIIAFFQIKNHSYFLITNNIYRFFLLLIIDYQLYFVSLVSSLALVSSYKM